MLSALLLTACYNDVVTPSEVTQVDILSRFNDEGEAYLTLQIPLGGQAMTRTEFDDGDDNEWMDNEGKLKDVYFLIFAGTSESDATFASAYKVTSPTLSISALEQVTATVTIAINDKNLNTGDNLYVFALLNNNASAISSFSLSRVTFASGTTITTGSTLANLQAVTIASYVDEDGFFLMTNAPLADANDGTGSVSTLVEVPATYFFPTEAEAIANPGGHIYVERAAAKVTTTLGSSLDLHIKGNSNIDFATTDFYYSLYNYNTASYLVRQVSNSWLPYTVGASNYRFTETAPLPDGKCRTYWAQDMNYNGSGTDIPDIATMKGWKAPGTSDYCAENTFSVASMKDESTTSVLVALNLNGGNHFYTTSVTGSDIIYQMPANEVSEEGTSASSSFSRRKSNYVTSAKTIDEYLREWLMETNSGFRNWVNTYAAGEPKHVNITVQSQESGFGLTDARVTSVTQTAQASGSTGATAFTSLNLISYFTNNIKIQFYEHGWCYYRVPIRHFSDTQTPWISIAAMTNNTTAQAYSAAAATAAGGSGIDAAFLGRYGMVRNNWYDISITSVTHIGSPVIPTLTSDADDEVEQLLNTTLQISSWTTHNQNL